MVRMILVVSLRVIQIVVLRKNIIRGGNPSMIKKMKLYEIRVENCSLSLNPQRIHISEYVMKYSQKVLNLFLIHIQALSLREDTHIRVVNLKLE